MKTFAVCAILAAVFSMTACDWNPVDHQRFASHLQGTWVSEGLGWYYGTLEITFDRITISGYGIQQTPEEGNDNKRPFRQFIKGVPLVGFSEEGDRTNGRIEGLIFIEDFGRPVSIPYIWYELPLPSPPFGHIQFLRFYFGGERETLRRIEK